MIDVSNLVKRVVVEAINDNDVFVTTNYIDTFEKLPAITVYETGNSVDISTADCDTIENYVQLTYDINVYTDNVARGKQLAKDLFTKVDNAFIKLGIYRDSKFETPNVDRSVFRITGRYYFKVSKDIERDGDTINFIYRR